MIVAINQMKKKIRSACINTPTEDIHFTIKQAPNRSNTRLTKNKILQLIKKNYSYNLSNFLIPNNTFILQGHNLHHSLIITTTSVTTTRTGYKIDTVTPHKDYTSPSHRLSQPAYLKRIIKEELLAKSRQAKEIKGDKLTQAIAAINDF